MKITQIERQKKSPSRRSIFLDDKFAFGVSEDILLQYGLYEGQDVTQEEVKQIEDAEAEQTVKASALRYRSFRPRSAKEMSDFLQKKGFDQRCIAAAIEHLIANNLLDDEEFARMYCRDKMHLKPVGRRVLQQQLFKKGIAKETVHKVVDEFYSAEVEQSLALKDAEKKIRRIAAQPPLVVKRRLYEHLVRHGYDASLSRSIVNQLVK